MAREVYPPALSKTAKYKKYTKPMLERKRRARINRCLDELKDLMVGALEIDDENLSKLEKADILELTVNHLMKLHSPKDPVLEAKKFQAGFGQCAAEACRFIMALPDLDANVSQNLVNHLSHLVSTQPLSIQVPTRPTYSPPISPPSPSLRADQEQERMYYSDEKSSTDGELEEPYADRYRDDDSQYSAASNWSQDVRMPVSTIRATPSVRELSSPMSGLLTTVGRIHSPPKNFEPSVMPAERPRGHQFFNRVPPECKDAILQKIRQHIMDKRSNEPQPEVYSDVPKRHEYVPRISVREDLTKPDNYQSYGHSSSDTLDLRKVRTPIKQSPEKMVSNYSTPSETSNVTPLPLTVNKLQIDNANERPVGNKMPSQQCNVPEQLAVDYSNLPPKKKRKLLEYQEYKKQEESKRLEEIAKRQRQNVHENDDDGPHRENVYNDYLQSQWRPW